MTFEERNECLSKFNSLDFAEKEIYILNSVKEYELKKQLSIYEEIEKIDEKTFYYNNIPGSKETVDLINSTIDINKEKFYNKLNYKTFKPINIEVMDTYVDNIAYVKSTGVLSIKRFQPEIDNIDIYKNTIIHEYTHLITLDKILEKGGQDFSNVPRWFLEGFAQWAEVNIGNSIIVENKISKVELKIENNVIPKLEEIDFYHASYRIINDIFKEVGLEGIERYIELCVTSDEAVALKEVTGKSLEDYYYIFED